VAAIGGGEAERQDAVSVRPVRIGARTKQDVGGGQIVTPHGQVQSGGPVRLARVHVGAAFQQGSQGCEIGALDGIDERHAKRRGVRGTQTQHDKKRHGGESHVQAQCSPSLPGISSAAPAVLALNVVFFRHSYCLNANAYSELPAFIATY
jgi:hypothetical protein